MVAELISHNEHQLALEFLFDYLNEESAEYANDLVQRFQVLQARLGATGGRDSTRLGH